jgi:D-alanyl-D-alanine carboxypeptidase/D-alanyl-D-alanine-endopeptidase (penicillin-binding protein 4)
LRNSRSSVLVLALALGACSRAAPAVTAPSASASDASLQQDLDRLLAAPPIERAVTGVLVRSLATDRTLYAHNPRTLLLPASTLKVVVLAAAAERLGWDFAYETRLLGAGAIDFGFLDGDLIVVGSGDPSLDDWDGAAGKLFEGWAERLKAAGIRAVGGRLVGDDNLFDDEGLGRGWAWDDLGASFATSVGALQFNENTARLQIFAGRAVGDKPRISVETVPTAVTIGNFLDTGPADAPVGITARRPPGATLLELRGIVPLSDTPVSRRVSVDNPTLHFVTALRDALVQNGIEMRGPPVDIDDLPSTFSRQDAVELLTRRSPPLSELGATMMRLSQNLYAETMLRTLGGAAGTATAGRAALLDSLARWGIEPSTVSIADGSGLSRYNLITCEALVTVLARMYADERLRGAFEASLPVAGRDGTLGDRMRGTPAEGNARAKTGGMSGVRGLTGYVRSAVGEPLAFAVLVNNFTTPAEDVERAIDGIVIRLATHKGH